MQIVYRWTRPWYPLRRKRMQGLGTQAEIREAVRTRYSQVAREPDRTYGFRVGRAFAEALGYPAQVLENLPASLSQAFTGVACSALPADVQPGQTVVDLGSGGGLDLALLAGKGGPEGRAIGIDFALDMVDRAQRNLAGLELHQVEVRQAGADETGLVDASIDWVVINACSTSHLTRAPFYVRYLGSLHQMGSFSWPRPPSIRHYRRTPSNQSTIGSVELAALCRRPSYRTHSPVGPGLGQGPQPWPQRADRRAAVTGDRHAGASKRCLAFEHCGRLQRHE